MELIKHELYKIFLIKSVCILFIIITVFNGVYFAAQIHFSKVDNKVVSNFIKHLEGTITDSKAEKALIELKHLNNLYNQESIWSVKSQQLFRMNVYSKLIKINETYQTKEETLNSIHLGTKGASGFDNKNIVLLYNMTKASSINKFYYTGGWDDIIGYVNEFGSVIMAAFILLGLSSMFCGEYASKMDSIILSSKYGKTKLIKAKVIAATSYILVVMLFFNMLNFLENLSVFGIHGWNAPLQCLNGFMYSPYKISVLQYYFIQLLIHIMACIAFGLFILLISTISKTQILTFFIGVLVFVVPYLIDKATPMKTNPTELITRFSFSWFMQVEKIFNSYKTYDILDKPVLYPIVIIGLAIIFIPFSYMCIDKTFKNHGMNF